MIKITATPYDSPPKHASDLPKGTYFEGTSPGSKLSKYFLITKDRIIDLESPINIYWDNISTCGITVIRVFENISFS